MRQKRIGAAGAGVASAAAIGIGVLFASGSGGSIDVFVGSTPTPTATSTSTPTPTATPGSCLATDNCYPKPTSSGAGSTGVPSTHTANQTCSTSPSTGQVQDDCLISCVCTITTTGAGATYRFSRFNGGMITHDGTGPLLIEDSTLGPSSGCESTGATIVGPNYTLRRIRVTQFWSEGPRDSDDNILLEESFIGPICSNPGDHADGFQGYFGGNNVIVRHNTIDIRPAEDVTAAIFVADNSESAQVEDNLLMGGGYTVRLHDDFTPDHGPWTLIRNRIVDNSWRTGGPMNNSGTTFDSSTCQDNRLVTIDGSYNITSTGSIITC